MKSWLASKTIWWNVVVGVLLVLSNNAAPFIDLFAVDVQPLLTGWVATAGVVGNVIVRFFTSLGITLKTPIAG